MTRWTDEQLEGALRDTFSSREELAEPARASALARNRPHRRRWPVIGSVAASVAIVAGGTSYLLAAGGDTAPPPPVATSPTRPAPGATTAENVATTRAYDAWLLHAVPLPDGSVESDHSPAPALGAPSLGMCPSDDNLRLTTWWTVPLAADDFRAWVATHLPAGLHLDDARSRSGTVLGFSVSGDDTAAYTTPAIALDYVALGEQTAVRIDTLISARFGRDTFVPESTTDVTLRRTRREAGQPDGDAVTRHLLSPGAVSRLVAAVNRMPGVSTSTCVSSCPVIQEESIYALHFSGPDGSYALRGTENLCFAGASLARDGTRSEPRLDADPSFFRQLDRLFRRP